MTLECGDVSPLCFRRNRICLDSRSPTGRARLQSGDKSPHSKGLSGGEEAFLSSEEAGIHEEPVHQTSSEADDEHEHHQQFCFVVSGLPAAVLFGQHEPGEGADDFGVR